MTRPTAESPISVHGLAACCAKAQADGVPCTSLGRACTECERAMAPRDPDLNADADPNSDDDDSVDYWAV